MIAATGGAIAAGVRLDDCSAEVKNRLEAALLRQGNQLLQPSDGAHPDGTIHLQPDGFWMRLSAGFDDLWLWQDGEGRYGYQFRFPTRAIYTVLVGLVIAMVLAMTLWQGRSAGSPEPWRNLALILIFWGGLWPYLAITSHKRRLRRLLERALNAVDAKG